MFQKDEMDEDDTKDPPCIVYLASCVAAIGGLLFGKMWIVFEYHLQLQTYYLLGYDMGIISGAKPQLQKELGLSCHDIGRLANAKKINAWRLPINKVSLDYSTLVSAADLDLTIDSRLATAAVVHSERPW